ncbi:MAG: DUF2490 domain-containing protein [Gemmatimonadaceae bacterium]
MNRLVRTAVALTAIAAIAEPAHAQLRKTANNTNMWFSYYGDAELAGKWGLIYDFSVRRSGPLDEMYALFARAGLTYAISPNVRVGAGVNRSETWPYGEVPIAYRTPERRLWEQLQLTHSAGRVSFAHRYRLEQRWQGHKNPPSEDVDNWIRTNRFRYQLRATVPLQGKTLDPHEWYASAADELFISFGSNVQYNVFDQNRASLALGYRFNKVLRFETGYMEHLALKSSGKQLEDNHTITFALYTTFTRNHAK